MRHLGHRNIVYGESTWSDKKGTRPFATIEEHDETLIYNINSCVKESDTLYFLGDGVMGGRENIYRLWSKINCKNIHYVLGNHDQHIRKNTILKTEKGFINAKNLFRTCNELLEKKIGDITYIMCHYSLRTWHKAHKGSIMLHGHSHGSLPSYEIFTDRQDQEYISSKYVRFKNEGLAKTIDVGVDTHPEFRPYNLEEIRKIMEQRINLKIDHHE